MIYDLYPDIVSGDTALEEIAHILDRKAARHPLLVIQGKGRARLTSLLSALRDTQCIPTGVVHCGSRPTVDPAVLVSAYRERSCDSIISMGGGRIHGAAKLASAMITDPPTGKADTVRPPHCIVTAPSPDGLEVSGTGLPGLPGIRFQSDAIRPAAIIIDDRILKTSPRRSHIAGALVTLLLISEQLIHGRHDPFTLSWILPSLQRLSEALLPAEPADGGRRRTYLTSFRVALAEAAILASAAQVVGSARFTPAAALMQLCVFQHGVSAEASAWHLLPTIIDELESGPLDEQLVDGIKRIYERLRSMIETEGGAIPDLHLHPLCQGLPPRSSLQTIYTTLTSLRSEISVVPEDIRRVFHA